MFFFMSGISLLFLQNKLFYDIHDILRAKDTLTTTCIFRSEKIEIVYLNLRFSIPYISILVWLKLFFCNILQRN